MAGREVFAVAGVALDRVTKVFDDGTVAVDDVTLSAASGEFLVLLGPTGCGKSTILRLVAGLESVTSGHVLIGGARIEHLPARERRVAMVFQEYALYPHITVAQNIGFPLRVRHESSADIASRVAEVAQQLGIAEHLHRQPAALSGGERQRVAMARAIVRDPQVFLLDEPLSNLDAGLRAELRSDVAALARRIGVTTIYVTHDRGEALTIADRIAVLRRGVLQQIAAPRELYREPATLFVAAFLGSPRTNLLEGAVYAEGGRTVVDLGSQLLEVPADDPRAAALRVRHAERVTVALRPDALKPTGPDAPGPVLRGTVLMVEHLGHEVLVRLDTGAVPTPPTQIRLDLPEGDVPTGELPAAQPLRPAAARIRPRRPPERAYGLRPDDEPELPGVPAPAGEVLVRLPSTTVPHRGESMTMAVDPARMLLFDHAGARIRLDPA
jgi:multiple sugar transport system ATP-binding protein